jgi:hypothetical protein
VKLRELFDVRGLEVVGPQNPEVLLGELRPVFLDDQAACAEDLVV